MATVVYKPEGSDVEYRIDTNPDDYESHLLEAIEDVTGWTTVEWVDQMSRGSIKALHALIWLKLRETAPDLGFDQVRFKMSEIVAVETAEVPEDPKASEPDDAGTGN